MPEDREMLPEPVAAPPVYLHPSGESLGLSLPDTYASTARCLPEMMDLARQGNRDAKARLTAFVQLTHAMAVKRS